jgi:hypothetical protein
MTKPSTCPNCGKKFTPWRAQAYCSVPCRKRAENVRAGRVKDGRVVRIREDDGAFPQKSDSLTGNTPENKATPRALREDGPLEWTACNQVTRALRRIGSPTVIGWTMLCEISPGREEWFGRIGDDFSFGPTTQARAKASVEARLKGEPFDKVDDERSWSGSCWRLLSGSAPLTEDLALAA